MQSEWPDTEALIALAKQPAELEKFRRLQIEKLIASAPEDMQRRLRGLQFQIDCMRKLHRSPMGTCIALSKMMFDSVYQLNDALHGLQPNPAEAKPAVVLPFTRAV